MKKKNRIFSFLDVTVVIIITSIIMSFLGGLLVFKHLGGVNFSLLDNDENLKEFISAYDNLLENYYDSLDKNALIDGAINGMYGVVGDPYTTYLDSEDTSLLNDSLTGKYEGIGIKIMSTEENEIIIDEVFDNSPASSVGLLKGDKIIKVNGESIVGKDTKQIADMIKNGHNESVEITVNRNGSEFTFSPKIEELLVSAITSQTFNRNNKNIGYINLTVFNDTADVQFSNVLSKIEKNNISSLIIDLRNNTGGYLQVAKNIAEMFIKKGKVIYSLENKNEKNSYYDESSESRSYPIVVLVNKSSASASEILAAALRDSYGAVLVGETSYGKGKVQEKATLTDGTTIKYTTAQWLTPNNVCIDNVGLTPDYEVLLDTTIYNKEDLSTDSQLNKALEILVD